MCIRLRFKSIRESKGISQLSLAKLSKLSNGMICRYEQGRNDITVENLMLLLDCIGSSPAELFGDELHAIPVLELNDIATPVGEIRKTGDYGDCYALMNRERGFYPIGSVSIINPMSEAVYGDVVVVIDKNGQLHYEKYHGTTPYIGVVVSSEWTEFRQQ